MRVKPQLRVPYKALGARDDHHLQVPTRHISNISYNCNSSQNKAL